MFVSDLQFCGTSRLLLQDEDEELDLSRGRLCDRDRLGMYHNNQRLHGAIALRNCHRCHLAAPESVVTKAELHQLAEATTE